MERLINSWRIYLLVDFLACILYCPMESQIMLLFVLGKEDVTYVPISVFLSSGLSQWFRDELMNSAN